MFPQVRNVFVNSKAVNAVDVDAINSFLISRVFVCHCDDRHLMPHSHKLPVDRMDDRGSAASQWGIFDGEDE